jgi:hypothetical protein
LGTALALIWAVFVPTAAGAGGNAIINDCESNGQLTHSYTVPELRHALAIMAPLVKEYSDCYDVLSRAELSAVGNRHGSGRGAGGSAGSFLPTPVTIILVLLVLAAVSAAIPSVVVPQTSHAASASLPGSNRASGSGSFCGGGRRWRSRASSDLGRRKPREP